MTRCVTTYFLAAALAAAACVSGAAAETPEEEIRRAILQLGAEKFEDRGLAEALLLEIGPEAALLYRPGDQGRDPEISSRMGALLETWGYRSVDSLRDNPGPARILPWDDPARVPRAWWLHVDDDRMAETLAARAEADMAARLVCLTCEKLPLPAPLVAAGLQHDPRGTIALLAERDDAPPPALRDAILAEARRQCAEPGADAAGIVAWRLGDRRALLDAVAGGRVSALQVLDRARADREVREALAKAFAAEPERVQWRFPAPAFAEAYEKAGAADHLGELGREAGEAPLRRLLARPEAAIRFRAAAWLNSWGLDAPGLELFDRDDVIPADGRLWAPEALVAAAARIPGDDVEARLRRRIEGPLSEEGRVLALRVLCARGRERDITFVHVHLKQLPPRLQPAVAAALAELGSASGVGILIPHLTGMEFGVRGRAHEALRRITGQDFGYDAAAGLAERCRAARRWARWWAENRTTFSPGRK